MQPANIRFLLPTDLNRMGWMIPTTASECQGGFAVKQTRATEPPAIEVTTIGIDLAKRIFQVHAVDAAGKVIVRKALRQAQVLPFFAKLSPCLVGMEPCGTSHHWAEVSKVPPA